MGQTVPPQNWVLKEMLALVNEGVITGVPPFFFQGGKSWTRGELAAILGNVFEDMEREGADHNRGVIESLRRLRREMNAELNQLNVEQQLSYSELWQIREQKKKKDKELVDQDRDWGISGSSTSAWSQNLSTDDGVWRENLNVAMRKGDVKADVTLLAQQEATEPFEVGLREFRFGGRAKGILDKYSVTWDKEDEKLGRLQSIAGFTGGSSWSKGLVVGNMNLEGTNFLWDLNAEERIEWVTGRTQSVNADKLSAIHYRKVHDENLTWMLQGVGAWYDDASSSGARGLKDESVWGGGVEWFDDHFEGSFEMATSSRGGYGAYAEALMPISHWGELIWNGRHYEDFDFDYHSPQVYSGISGGDDIQEKGMGVEASGVFDEKYGVVLALDSSFEGASGRLYYAYGEASLEESWADFSLSFEHEWSRLHLNRITTFRASRSFDLGWRASLDWSRDKVEGEGSDSTRLAVYWDALQEVLSFSSSLSNRHSSTGRNLTQQFGVNWNITSYQFLSLQTTFSRPDSADNNAEINYLVKF